MDLNKPLDAMPPADRKLVAEHLALARHFGSPRNVWVEDGHVFVEGDDGEIVSMTPKTAIEMGRRLSDAGADAVINKVIYDSSAPAPQPMGG